MFTLAFKYIKSQAILEIKRHNFKRKHSLSDILWIVSIPAIWSPESKTTMTQWMVDANMTFFFLLFLHQSPTALVTLCCKAFSFTAFVYAGVLVFLGFPTFISAFLGVGSRGDDANCYETQKPKPENQIQTC